MGLTGEFVVTRKSRAVRHEQAVNKSYSQKGADGYGYDRRN